MVHPNGNANGTVNGNGSVNGNANGLGESSAHEPRGSLNSGSTIVDGRSHARIRQPRSLPPWISSYEERYGRPSEDQLELLSPPPQSRLPHHNSTPCEPQPHTTPPRRASRDGYIDWSTEMPSDEDGLKKKVSRKHMFKKGYARGRKWDHLRTAEPVIVTGHSPEPMARWKEFMQSSQYGRTGNEESHVVEPEYLNQLQPQFNQPFELPKPSKKPREKMTAAKFWKVLVQHPLVPLVFRLIVLVTSIVALALSVRIFELESQNTDDSAERTQSLVAIVIDCLAVPYIGYMTWDEYTGQPLGLRSASQKASLVLMDLFFIIFKASSTALSFEALVYHSAHDITLGHSRALAAFMFVGLAAWSFAFTVNVFRLVYKLDVSEDEIGARWMKSQESGLA
ncbi:uncharacterized protein MKZ38_008166 [Zalerion maritima]|uniref:Regulator of phospholipase D SRF1 n=1 Tax=Zalerion maritima TaxID=339359 RepID=A0AAD5RV61_9PEZI|nr:uncharacterized protein MKZ38_008166 [Zalerion maritima]